MNGHEYSYLNDFAYAKSSHGVHDETSFRFTLQTKAVFTFNLPGYPTITECVNTEMDLVSGEYHGVFELTGTKMFHKIEGHGFESDIDESGVLNVIHAGLTTG